MSRGGWRVQRDVQGASPREGDEKRGKKSGREGRRERERTGREKREGEGVKEGWEGGELKMIIAFLLGVCIHN